MMIVSETIIYDDFGDEWRYKAILNEDNYIYVSCRKYATFNKVDFFIPFRDEWRCDPGASEMYTKIRNEVSRRINP